MDDVKNFPCTDCDRSFGTVQALTAHARVHKNKSEPVETAKDLLNSIDENPSFERISDEQWAAQVAAKIDEYVISAEDIPQEANSFGPLVIKVKRLAHAEDLPDLQYATSGSAAVDLYAAIGRKPLCIGATERLTIPTGLCVEIPEGFVGKVVPRSGLAFNHGITLVNSPGIIDSDYRGEIKVALVNHSHAKHWVARGERIAQMLIEPVLRVDYLYVDELSETDRGKGGFGSTGR